MRKPTTLSPIRPNAGTARRYQVALEAAIYDMAKSVEYWVRAQYRSTPPVLATDASPAEELAQAVARLRRRWVTKFATLAPKLSRKFVGAAATGRDVAIRSALRQHGWTVNFTRTPAVNDVLQAAVHENVSLIKSIPSRYFDQIEGMVMRSVTQGGDLQTLTDQLQHQFGVTRGRAKLIARDQNAKIAEATERARQVELGLYDAIWVHSGGGHHPRPDHVAANGLRFDVRQGCYIDGEWIQPGQKINCKCTRRIVFDMGVKVA